MNASAPTVPRWLRSEGFLLAVIMTIAGFIIGKIGRRVGFWESELAVLLTTALFVVHLAHAVEVVSGVGSEELVDCVDLRGLVAHGERFLRSFRWILLAGALSCQGNSSSSAWMRHRAHFGCRCQPAG